VQVVKDDSSYKAVNLGFLLRPEWAPGLQSGLSVYHDKPASASGRVNQSIIAAHLVYHSGVFEQLNEVVFIRDTPAGQERTSTSTGIYTQFSRRAGVSRFIYNVPGAIGYLRASEVDDNVKVVRLADAAVGAAFGFTLQTR
jgi:hypothetical protein